MKGRWKRAEKHIFLHLISQLKEEKKLRVGNSIPNFEMQIRAQLEESELKGQRRLGWDTCAPVYWYLLHSTVQCTFSERQFVHLTFRQRVFFVQLLK